MKSTARTRLSIIATVLILVFSIPTAAQKEIQVLPVDEAKKDPTFLAFREKLIAAVKKQDVKFLLETLDPDVQGSFGGDSGIADFKRLWKLDRKNSLLWKELLTILTNGGTFSKESNQKSKEFCAPYSYTNFPPDLDIFDTR